MRRLLRRHKHPLLVQNLIVESMVANPQLVVEQSCRRHGRCGQRHSKATLDHDARAMASLEEEGKEGGCDRGRGVGERRAVEPVAQAARGPRQAQGRVGVESLRADVVKDIMDQIGKQLDALNKEMLAWPTCKRSSTAARGGSSTSA